MSSSDIDIILKNNQTSGVVPAPQELELGEVAINTADGVLYAKKNDGTVVVLGGSEGVIVNNSYNAAVQWTANHTLADGTRYLANDLVYDNGKIYKANYDNESRPVSDTLYWQDLGAGYRLNIDGRDIPNLPVISVAGKQGAIVLSKDDVGLNNVDNTSDSSKPISDATQTALDTKAEAIHSHDDLYYTESEINSLLSNKQDTGNYAVINNDGYIPLDDLPFSVAYPVRAVHVGGMWAFNGWTYTAYPTGIIGDLKVLTTMEYPNQTVEVSVQQALDQYLIDNPDKTLDYASLEIALVDANNRIVGWGTTSTSNAAGTTNGTTGTSMVLSLFSFPSGIPNSWILGGLNVDCPASSIAPYTAYKQVFSKNLYNHNHSTYKYNTNIGSESLAKLNSGERNTSVGSDNLSNLTSGFGNSALGSGASYTLIDGSFNTSIGTFSQVSVTSGSDNNSVGYASLASTTTGIGNCAFGTNSLLFNTTGLHNIAIGYEALQNNTTGSYNIAIGLNAGTSSASLQNCICIGPRATAQNSGELVIASSAHPINTSSTVGSAGSASSLPSLPLGYIVLRLNGNLVKIPYYRN